MHNRTPWLLCLWRCLLEGPELLLDPLPRLPTAVRALRDDLRRERRQHRVHESAHAVVAPAVPGTEGVRKLPVVGILTIVFEVT